MKKSKYNYRIYNGKSIKKILENSRIYFMTAFFAVGIIIGAASLNNESILFEKISQIIESYTLLKADQGILMNFCDSLTVSAVFVFINLFLGFSMIGYPLLLFLPFLRGLGIGLVCGYLYSAFKLTGLGYSILVIYPGAIVSTFALFMACNDSCEYSKNAYLKAIRGRGQFEKNETKVYLLRQLVFFGILAASSLLDALFSKIFSGFFEI